LSTQSKIKLALFGATGSIGEQTIDVCSRLDQYQIEVLSAGSNWQKLAELAIELRPKWVTLASTDNAAELENALTGTGIKVLAGNEAAAEAALEADYDLALNGMVGVSGLLPSYHTLKRGINLALANKESLVLAGDLLNDIAAESGAKILAVDSEHCAIMQCLQGEDIQDVKRLILTASGGPFYGKDKDEIFNASIEQALAHPTWKMGRKISIDSATLMNKGLEVIEAYHLFGIPIEKIEVRVHPVSIVHSMVEFRDGTFKAQMGKPDMRAPIQYTLTYPNHKSNYSLDDDPVDWPSIEFFHVDHDSFPCLRIAINAIKIGGTAPGVLNGADEAVVASFLDGKIKFGEISSIIEMTILEHSPSKVESIDMVISADQWGRNKAMNMVEEITGK